MERGKQIGYWAATLYVAITGAVAGAMDLLRAPPLYDLLLDLGYPPHFAAVLGTWKVLGALALVAPRRPLLKEWAYAGMFFDFTSALVAHASHGDSATTYVGPLLAIAALAASWHLRPDARRLAEARWRA